MRKPQDRRSARPAPKTHAPTVAPMWAVVAAKWGVTPEQAFARMHGRETPQKKAA